MKWKHPAVWTHSLLQFSQLRCDRMLAPLFSPAGDPVFPSKQIHYYNNQFLQINFWCWLAIQMRPIGCPCHLMSPRHRKHLPCPPCWIFRFRNAVVCWVCVDGKDSASTSFFCVFFLDDAPSILRTVSWDCIHASAVHHSNAGRLLSSHLCTTLQLWPSYSRSRFWRASGQDFSAPPKTLNHPIRWKRHLEWTIVVWFGGMWMPC